MKPARALLVLCLVALAARVAHAQADLTTGNLRGQIRDVATGQPAGGAFIVATSPALQGEQAAIADEAGLYFLTALPPGDYTLKVTYLQATFTRGDVLVQVGKEAVVNVPVDSRAIADQAGEVITIHGTVPLVDQGSTKIGVSLTERYTRNLPVGRTFGSVIGAAAGAQGDFYGTSLAGATSIENTYIVNGINTTDPARGELSTNLPTEFLAETEVITGGYNAEYGRATGGVVNVVTKQGANEVHGSVFSYVTPGALGASARAIEKQGGSIATQNNLDYSYDVGAEVGGPIVPDRLWFHVGFDPSRTRNVLVRSVVQQVDDNQDGVPDFDPATGLARHKLVTRRDLPTASTTYAFTAKLDGQIDANNQLELSAFGNPRTGRASIYSLPYPETWAPNDQVFDRSDGAYDAAGRYTSKLHDGATQIDVIGGFHRSFSRQTPTGGATAQPVTEYDYTRSLFDFVDLEGPAIGACQDGGPNDRYPKIQNCPVNLYAEQGFGLLEQRTNDRISGALALTQRVKALGYHVLKLGADLEQASYDTTLAFTGGAQLRRFCNTDDNGLCSDASDAAPGPWRELRYGQVIRYLTPAERAAPASVALAPGQQIDGCLGGLAICGPADARHARAKDRSVAAFAQDSWQIVPSLTLNLGVRFERQTLFNADGIQGTAQPSGEPVPDVAFALNNWAPRVGVIFDPTAEGKAKLFAHWGRFYENIPDDLNIRAFGGEIISVRGANVHQRRPGEPGYDPRCNADHRAGANPATALAACSDVDPEAFLLGGGTSFVAPGISGQYTDELVVGAEYELIPDLRLGVTYTHRTLPNVIEDVSPDNGADFLIANPGANYSGDAARLAAQAAALASTDPARSAALAQQAGWLAQIKTFDKPIRNYDAVTLRAEQRPTARSLVIASYTYARERGNYPGLFSTETLQLDPNVSTQYDLPDLLANRAGPLGLDRPHAIKLDGFYLFDLARAGLVTVGASVRAQSGIAHNVLAAHPVYGDGESYLLPRGSIARSPMTSTIDLHVAYGHRLTAAVTLEAFVNVFNLLDQQDELNVDERYTFDNALPIVGGDANDLKHAKVTNVLPTGQWATANRTLTPNQNFDHTSQVTNPRSVQLGVRLTF
ncbi:MAG TPA: TonB-dependent receptor [Kofleriaceae bacterium]|nr:TonB-dependent receptor [Kofleriaceae bacterium]